MRDASSREQGRRVRQPRTLMRRVAVSAQRVAGIATRMCGAFATKTASHVGLSRYRRCHGVLQVIENAP
jgi:hypothetical protein